MHRSPPCQNAARSRLADNQGARLGAEEISERCDADLPRPFSGALLRAARRGGFTDNASDRCNGQGRRGEPAGGVVSANPNQSQHGERAAIVQLACSGEVSLAGFCESQLRGELDDLRQEFEGLRSGCQL
jgi:hypothetical protein